MSKIRIKQILFFQLIAAIIVVAVSCNSKTEDDETEIAVTPAVTAIKKFYLQANDSVLSHLDSVAFSIDLNTGVIFNADSLPVGTNVSRLIPVVTFANAMTKAEFVFLKDGEKEKVDYLTNPNDSIDFTHPVTLDVTAQDGVNTFTYQIRVNVHKQNPDTLIWANIATMPLPSASSRPVAQKTVYHKEKAYSLIKEQTGECTLAICGDLNEGQWETINLGLNFEPRIESFTSTPEELWILSTDGALNKSIDGESWQEVGEIWENIIGAYGESILGIRNIEGELYHTKYPLTADFTESLLEEGFPVAGYSTLGQGETSWTPDPFVILTGGATNDGTLTSAVWGYDGETWAILNEGYLPALYQPMMAHYVVYRDTQQVFKKRRFEVWLLFGGTADTGEMNRKVYMSYDNGVTWMPAPELMQMPKYFPTLRGADVIVAGYDLSADLSEAWTLIPDEMTTKVTRSGYTIEGFEITWICPYLYVFGGYEGDDVLSTDIWRGVLARLQFTPLI